jgi:hypothetical protein
MNAEPSSEDIDPMRDAFSARLALHAKRIGSRSSATPDECLNWLLLGAAVESVAHLGTVADMRTALERIRDATTSVPIPKALEHLAHDLVIGEIIEAGGIGTLNAALQESVEALRGAGHVFRVAPAPMTFEAAVQQAARMSDWIARVLGIAPHVANGLRIRFKPTALPDAAASTALRQGRHPWDDRERFALWRALMAEAGRPDDVFDVNLPISLETAGVCPAGDWGAMAMAQPLLRFGVCHIRGTGEEPEPALELAVEAMCVTQSYLLFRLDEIASIEFVNDCHPSPQLARLDGRYYLHTPLSPVRHYLHARGFVPGHIPTEEQRQEASEARLRRMPAIYPRSALPPFWRDEIARPGSRVFDRLVCGYVGRVEPAPDAADRSQPGQPEEIVTLYEIRDVDLGDCAERSGDRELREPALDVYDRLLDGSLAEHGATAHALRDREVVRALMVIATGWSW